MNHIGRFGLLLGIMFFITGIQPLWADTTPISIEIGQGSGGGYSYSGIHEATSCGSNNLCMGGAKLYWAFSGTLSAVLDTDVISLTSITGTLTAPQGKLQITGGQLSDPAAGGFASGFLDYTFLTGTLKDEAGTFYFVDSQQMCCSGAINGGPNNLTASGFTLWGNNWDITNNQTRDSIKGTPLGIDLVGGQYTTTPEPSTMMLLGSGLLALPFLRKKKQ
jgi:hypothetical protein